MKVVIPSRRRTKTIVKESLSVIPDAYVLVDEVERDDYQRLVASGDILKDRLITHPSLPTLSHICNFAMDWAGDDPWCIFGDDHTGLVSIPGWTPRKLSGPKHAYALMYNALNCAHDAGAGLWGFGRNSNPTMYEPSRPIRLAQWVCSPLGFVPGHGLRFDERFALMLDVDLNMQSLLKHRIVWFDSRFCFVGKGLHNPGGNAHLRSDQAYAAERELLKQKWGRFIRFDTNALPGSQRYEEGRPSTTLMTYFCVPRTQAGF